MQRDFFVCKETFSYVCRFFGLNGRIQKMPLSRTAFSDYNFPPKLLRLISKLNTQMTYALYSSGIINSVSGWLFIRIGAKPSTSILLVSGGNALSW